VDGKAAQIARRAGLDARPIVRLEGIEDRSAAEALSGHVLTVERSSAPPLDENEWWAGDLEGCEVVDRDRKVGIVCGLLELPSCEALEVRTQGANEQLLIPMVRDAIRSVNVVGRLIDVDMSFLEAD
jgi:16S rRNA processing protein RimM